MRGHHRTARAALAGLACLAGLLVPGHAGAQGNPLVEGPPRGADVPSVAPAEGERAEAQVTNPSATAIIRSLAPFADGNPNAPAPRRDLRDVDADGGRRRVRVDYGRAVDLTVFFAYDSVRLTPEALVQLEPLGRALQSPALLPYRFLLAGHTDGAGDPRYNLGLSLQRATAVRRHLSEAYGIDPQRLVAHGWGPTRLKDAARPLASVNRRVEVALIQPDRPSSRLGDPALPCGAGPVPGLGDDEDADEGSVAPCAVTARLAGPVGPALRDPRRHLPPDALDDFDAMPTPLAFP